MFSTAVMLFIPSQSQALKWVYGSNKNHNDIASEVLRQITGYKTPLSVHYSGSNTQNTGSDSDFYIFFPSYPLKLG